MSVKLAKGVYEYGFQSYDAVGGLSTNGSVTSLFFDYETSNLFVVTGGILYKIYIDDTFEGVVNDAFNPASEIDGVYVLNDKVYLSPSYNNTTFYILNKEDFTDYEYFEGFTGQITSVCVDEDRLICLSSYTRRLDVYDLNSYTLIEEHDHVSGFDMVLQKGYIYIVSQGSLRKINKYTFEVVKEISISNAGQQRGLATDGNRIFLCAEETSSVGGIYDFDLREIKKVYFPTVGGGSAIRRIEYIKGRLIAGLEGGFMRWVEEERFIPEVKLKDSTNNITLKHHPGIASYLYTPKTFTGDTEEFPHTVEKGYVKWLNEGFTFSTWIQANNTQGRRIFGWNRNGCFAVEAYNEGNGSVLNDGHAFLRVYLSDVPGTAAGNNTHTIVDLYEHGIDFFDLNWHHLEMTKASDKVLIYADSILIREISNSYNFPELSQPIVIASYDNAFNAWEGQFFRSRLERYRPFNAQRYNQELEIINSF